MTVGTITGNSTSPGASRNGSSAALVPTTTSAAFRSGVWSTGAEASRPWNVWPTTATSIEPLASAGSPGSSSSPADPNSAASFAAASFAPAGRIEVDAVRKKS